MIFQKKLSFKTARDSKNLIDQALCGEVREEALDIIEFYENACGEDAECAFALGADCLLVRIFDMGRYFFPFPYALSTEANISDAISNIVRYSMLEEIEAVFSGVEIDDLRIFLDAGYRHLDVDADTPEGDSYRVRIKTECELISDIPTLSDGEIEISALAEDDTAEYAALCRDNDSNRYWGYDFREDNPNADDAYFLEMARNEFFRSVAVVFAVRFRNSFIGEAVLHAFDGKGGADLAIRILPEYRGRGYGRRTVELLRSAAENMGLVALYARVDRTNTASCALFSSVSKLCREDGGVLVFNV